ncbi:uncharacterized protein K452DRAFT_302193 [Aplosporella prunicola CBS 121167]|uniref:Maintenance of telomere capping protein 6 n=1 Tax=Aplosporella prunicola CBS 121167 TaxID=1176127 RepID=A0A6A6B0S5_9PEZI|nr:uncharacterized protein K452DRAFT_302193 [Aplosporella prunicola CBS 121167]KAF2137158.1 hypothetical protein K452DRAFT_302193 [Aplosporella prunicola CBS 121167]
MASSQYAPAGGAVAVPPWNTAWLSQRDAAISIPINFVTRPAVSLTEACFSKNSYLDGPAGTCLSNLLATGYRSIIVDAYWDESRAVWSLCPAAIPEAAANDDDSTVQVVTSTSQAQLSSARMTGKAHRQARQTASGGSDSSSHQPATLAAPPATGRSTASSASPAALTTASLASGVAAEATAAAADSNRKSVLHIGPYTCSSGLSVSFIANLIADYLDATSDTLAASVLFLTINVHAASPSRSPTRPALAPASSAVPTANSTLSNLLENALSAYLYTPTLLREDRENLNSSWYAYNVGQGSRPNESYFSTTLNADETVSTADGWPSEGYLLFGPNHDRVLASFGRIDPQMEAYATDVDHSTIFPAGTFEARRDVTVTPSGSVADGCFFNANDTRLDNATNSSWATSSEGQIAAVESGNLYSPVTASISNITACGVSYLLNQSLGIDANTDYRPYRDIALSSMWSWAPGEPRNVTNRAADAQLLRCATMRAANNGRWVLTDCTEKYHMACRVPSEPYTWRISNSSAAYNDGETRCPEGTYFDVPRTALENTYLLSALRESAAADPEAFDLDLALWIDFNSLDTPGCWVVGATTRCYYNEQGEEAESRLVIVPTVAAVIVFVLAALTVFVKCAANRQTSRRGRRRKGDEGWDYEGVPS